MNYNERKLMPHPLLVFQHFQHLNISALPDNKLTDVMLQMQTKKDKKKMNPCLHVPDFFARCSV